VPWNGRTPMDLRMEFMARLNKGERMTDLCVEYGISRKTGHKLKKRYEELGVSGLVDQSRAPKHIPHKTSPQVIELVVAERVKHPNWGPRKLKDVMEKRLGHSLPSASTFATILLQRGLVERRPGRRRYHSRPTILREANAPNDVWCIDYKGQFRLGDGSYCYPLTLTDQRSRYILGCEAMSGIDEDRARETCETIFRTCGLPSVIRSDNGTPFASVGLAGLSKLSVYWMRLGITPERIRPAHPQENGQHERMHRTLKRETTRPARTNLLQQQEVFDAFVEEFNVERPHEALGMKRPAQVYSPSTRKCPDSIADPDYSTHDDVIQVGARGLLTLYRRKQVYLGIALAGQPVGVREQDDGRWLVSFMHIDLGYLETNNTFTPAGTPTVDSQHFTAYQSPPTPPSTEQIAAAGSWTASTPDSEATTE
jgi:transposase InsO family protein